MNSSTELKVAFLIAFGIIFTFLHSFNVGITLNVDFYCEKMDFCNDVDLTDKTLKSSVIANKIHIDNNWTETKAAGLCTGEGTFSDPYVIENLVIDNGGSERGIFIENSDAFFIIKDCTINNWGEIPTVYRDIGSIELGNVMNAKLVNNTCSNSSHQIGIYIYNSDHNNITCNIVENNYHGIKIVHSDWNIINDNEACNNHVGISVGSTNIQGGTIISGNLLINNNNGMDLGSFYNSLIIENIVKENNFHGLMMSSSHGNTILRNNIVNNGEYGLFLSRCRYNNISENSIDNNHRGIYLDESDSNLIIGNNLINNNLCWKEVDCENNLFEENVCEDLRNRILRIMAFIIGLLSILGLIAIVRIYILKKKKKNSSEFI